MSASIRLERTGVAREAAEMILTDDSYFVTVIATARQGRVVWDNLRKVLLVNTPINNA
jgi:magnesium-transporting ATPase (P-type)